MLYYNYISLQCSTFKKPGKLAASFLSLTYGLHGCFIA